MKTRLVSAVVLLLVSGALISACRRGRPVGPTPTPAAAKDCIESPAGLVGWWPADEEAKDVRGGNDGTLLDGATLAAGLVGQAFSFDGAGRVSAPTAGLPTGQGDRTLELWVKVNTFLVGEAFFAGYGKFGSADQTYHLGTTGKTLFFSQWGQAIAGPALETSRWYHVAVTNAGTRVTLYLDGAAVGAGDLRMDTPGGTHLYIGSLPGEGSKRLDGLVDEVAIYDRALSAAEIQAIYRAGSNGRCK